MRGEIFFLIVFIASAIAMPTDSREEESRLSNEILPGVIEVQDETSQEVITTTKEEAITTRQPALDDPPTVKPGIRKTPKQNGSTVSQTFSRVIDDIFNIPISVLRAVNTLLNNAFGNKSTPASSAGVTSIPEV
ncbi:uncharacterized protein LOC107266842 [Cephus cinctus]|uniref:Uncharacterized protein LOC107266842 n=1 Tax=Cephus cinctus TaxID=211228 RepID=A0AAJ7BT17_CEPCN|nr:uncharacterized protein LOC107266842 [Cephus cinctus]XP_015593243.1 uncharacterized protein LOC107266842 [Cephus cinctus]